MTSLSERGKQVRRDTLTLSSAHGGYHYGGCFSAVEILTTLFDRVMDRSQDLFILSKGHACWPLYVLLREQGLSPRLEGHPVRDPGNGIHATTGSLGHGLPMGIGMAMARRQRGRPGTIWVLLGDGECQEGTTWESLLIGAAHRPLGPLGNLVAVVDWNQIQGSDRTVNVLPLPAYALLDLARSLGWEARDVAGHDEEILEGVLRPSSCERPRLVIARTLKGRGVSFMEDRPEWHARWPDRGEMEKAMKELS
jgi:transketolase